MLPRRISNSSSSSSSSNVLSALFLLSSIIVGGRMVVSASRSSSSYISAVPKGGTATIPTSSSNGENIMSSSSSNIYGDGDGDSDSDENNATENGINIIFSDLDGTLIHYPKPPSTSSESESSESESESTNESKNKNKPNNNNNNSLLQLPPSSTGMRGVISSQTLCSVRDIRGNCNNNGVKFVLISGMRTSTLLQRLPYLPKADAYCSENGGRIFYPVVDESTDLNGNANDNVNDNEDIFWVHPKKYDGSNNNNNNNNNNDDDDDLKPFGIREDKAWRQRMTVAMGGDSFGSFSLKDIHQAAQNDPTAATTPLNERDGLLWDFARDLIHNHHFVLDTKGYSTCFRVNRKHQHQQQLDDVNGGGDAFETIVSLLDTPPWIARRDLIASSVNLKCVDFYPSCSGKKNCCLYLASKFFPEQCQSSSSSSREENNNDSNNAENTAAAAAAEQFVSNHAVCLCDDDNDLEMALACGHAYLPDVSSQSMKDTIARFPNHFTQTFDDVLTSGTDSSDLALSMIITKISQRREKE